jgi:hypothetical protein
MIVIISSSLLMKSYLFGLTAWKFSGVIELQSLETIQGLGKLKSQAGAVHFEIRLLLSESDIANVVTSTSRHVNYYVMLLTLKFIACVKLISSIKTNARYTKPSLKEDGRTSPGYPLRKLTPYRHSTVTSQLDILQRMTSERIGSSGGLTRHLVFDYELIRFDFYFSKD